MITSWLAKVACHVIGNVYAAYASYKAVLNQDPNEHKQWLSYWVVYAFFIVLEIPADLLIAWLPFYYELKLAFVVWLAFFSGATIMYDRYVRSYIDKYEKDIDKQLGIVTDATANLVGTVASQAKGHVARGSMAAAQLLLTTTTAAAAVAAAAASGGGRGSQGAASGGSDAAAAASGGDGGQDAHDRGRARSNSTSGPRQRAGTGGGGEGRQGDR